VFLDEHGLSIQDRERHTIALWRYDGLAPAAPIRRSANDALLRYTPTPEATLFIRGQGVARELLRRAPASSENNMRFRVVFYSAIPAVIAIALGAFLLFGPYSSSKAVARLMPFSMTDRIGLQSVGVIGAVAPECEAADAKAPLQHILDRLQSVGKFTHPFKLHVVRTKIANAFALPGRHIVLLSGLIERAKSAEEVAGVIAHEMGHGIEDDPEALFVRNLGMQALLQFLTGQSANQPTVAFGAMLLQLRYSREAERSADLHAIELLQKAHISAKPSADFFLRSAGDDIGDTLGYLNSHPPSAERAKLFLSSSTELVEPLIDENEWVQVQKICAGAD